MAATPVFTLEPLPHWVVIDNFSKLPNGAVIYTYRSLNPSDFKPAFQDSAGQIPYSQPISGFGNGTFPPIFWEFDPNNPTETYYIEVWSARKEDNGVLLWNFDGLSGGGGSGGGTVITSFDIENLVINGVFYRNIGSQAGTPSLPTTLTIAPSNNAGYVNDPNNANVIAGGPVGPDIIFAKNNITSSDSLNFVDFTPFGVHALPGPDVTPPQYINYHCTGAGAGETYKYVQFPICQGIQSLSNQPVTVKIYAQSLGVNDQLSLSWRMFFGSGGGSADIITPITTQTLTGTWDVYVFNSMTPDATGGTPGSCGNDALFLQVGFPLSPNTCNVNFVKPSVYLGTIAPGQDFHTNDMIDSIINTPRTGDVRISLNSFLPGWVAMNDGTIGDSTSGATRSNIDTFPLFDLIWNLFIGNQPLAPMFDNAGNPVAYGANSVADFNAHRRLSLTKEAGRVMAGVSGGHAIGTTVGVETYVLLPNDLPPHVHPNSKNGFTEKDLFTPTDVVGVGVNGISYHPNTEPNVTANNPVSLMQPTVYMNVFIKL